MEDALYEVHFHIIRLREVKGLNQTFFLYENSLNQESDFLQYSKNWLH